MVNRTVTFQGYDGRSIPTGSVSVAGMVLTLEECSFLLNLYSKSTGLLRIALAGIVESIELATQSQVAFSEQNKTGKSEKQIQHEQALELCKKRGWDSKNNALYIKAAREVLDR